jgi:DNA polymerase III alpha subunit
MASRANVWIARNEVDKATEAARWYAERWEDDFVVEVMGNLTEQVALQHAQRGIAKAVGARVLATNDVHYLDQSNGVEDGPHHVYVQSRRFKKADTEESTDRSDDGFGSWYGSDEFYLKDGDQMFQTAGLQRREIELSVELLDRVTFDFAEVPEPSPPVPLIPAPGEDPAFDAWIVQHGHEIQAST